MIEKTASLRYVEDMGDGWNLGNSFDSFDKEEDKEERSWGNPKVTKELIKAVKHKGYSSIRLPLTLHMRIGTRDTNFQIDQAFLDRYEEVLKWSIDEGLLVMINIHHDSVTWLKEWNGMEDAEEYAKFVRIWEQLAERFKPYGRQVMFESVNEPQFNVDEESSIRYLKLLNDAFYHIVRNSGGNNSTRMLVLPTLLTNDSQDKLDALYDQISGFNDENLIATVHYYSVWIYSANLGKTRFDQQLWKDTTPRSSLVEVFDRVADTFIKRGIGVVIGEYGLLGYDKSESANQFGETLKYIEFINYYAKEKGMCLMLWDNGQHLNRYDHEWYLKEFGEMIEKSMKERSSYATGLDTCYLFDSVPEGGLFIPLTLNGNEFQSVAIEGNLLNKEKEYTYEAGILHLTEEILTRLSNGRAAQSEAPVTLELRFSAGAVWHQKLIYAKNPLLKKTSGTMGKELDIPVEFNGNHLETVLIKNQIGEIVANNRHWKYLQHSIEFKPDEKNARILLFTDYTSLLIDGDYTITFTFFSGLTEQYQLTVEKNRIKGYPLPRIS